jgi:hypothetical protein
MLLSLWQGPMPWCHHHGSLEEVHRVQGSQATHSSNAGWWWKRHLQSQHVSAMPLANVTLGWHVHVGIPTSSGECPDSDRDHQTGLALPRSNTDVDLLQSIDLAAQYHPFAAYESWIGLVALQWSGDESSYHHHFFDGYASTLALPLRFGVIRC